MASTRHIIVEIGKRAALILDGPLLTLSIVPTHPEIARVRTQDNADLERVIMEIQKEGPVERTRSQVVLSQLVRRPLVASR